MQNYLSWKGKDGRLIINEKCRCGKLRTDHEDNHPVFAQGHGACAASKCTRFTWASFVFGKKTRFNESSRKN